MSALAQGGWEGCSRASKGALAARESLEEVAMRERLIAVRDTLLVLGLQIVFRVALMLRRWNY
jgi:hypothetical protein